MGKLDGKVAFITGAARGQGRSHAVRLAEEGADIIAVDICRSIPLLQYPLATPGDLEETVRLVEKLDRRIVATEADIRDGVALKKALDAGLTEFGHVDIVVANAGICTNTEGDADEREEAWAQVIDVNLTGTWRTIRLAVPHMIERGIGGSIVITSSTAGLKAISANTNFVPESYTASKHALVGLMRTFAKSLAPLGIRVNSVHPTGVNTPMSNNVASQARIDDLDPLEDLSNLLPVGRVEPEDIANAVAWLVSDDARYVTGVTLPVDAGFTLR